MRHPISSRFSPHALSAERRAQLLVGRDHLLSELVADFSQAFDSGSGRYEALVGPRGLGKSHLLGVVIDQLGAQSEAATIAMLSEEEHVSSWVGLLAKILAALPDEVDSPPAAELVGRLRGTPLADQEDVALGMIQARVGDRPLLIAMENLDEVLSGIGSDGQQKLRNALQSNGRWCVIATTTRWTEALGNRGQPLYRSFIRRDLGSLNPHQCRQMLMKLAEAHGADDFLQELRTPTGLARVRAIHHIAGGAPRAMAHLFPHLQQRSLDDLEGAFFDLAGELTPYYQEQINRRPTGQRPLLEALAENWQPLSVQELAERTFSTHQSTSGQLRYLMRDRLLTAIQVGRSRYYSLREPLFRIARSMKNPDGLAEAFVRFARGWFLPPANLVVAYRQSLGTDLPHPTKTAGGWKPAYELSLPLEAARQLDDPSARSKLSELADRIEAAFDNPGALRVARAVLAMPDSLEPYARLAPPERELARQIVFRHHGHESEWFTRLPVED